MATILSKTIIMAQLAQIDITADIFSTMSPADRVAALNAVANCLFVGANLTQLQPALDNNALNMTVLKLQIAQLTYELNTAGIPIPA